MEKFIPETVRVAVDHDPFSGPAIARTLPTTEAQQEVLLAASMGNDASCAYNESVSLELTGPLDRAALTLAVQQLAARHESLRSTLSPSGARMLVAEEITVPVPFTDLSAVSPAERGMRLEAIALQDMSTAFDLLNGPLLRVHLIRLSELEHVLRISGHHVICDGWSLGIMMAEISALYNANKSGTTAQLPPATPFSTYAISTFDFAKSPEHAAVERYWTDLFRGAMPQLDIPTDRPRPKRKTYNGRRIDLELESSLVRGLRDTATRCGASFVTTLLTTFELFLHRLTGETDMVVGLPAAGQSDLGMKHLVGHCVNLLALRSEIDDQRSFMQHLKQRRTAVLDAFDHQKYTFGTLLRKLNVPRVAGRIPLVPAVFNIDMNMDDGVTFDGLHHRFISNPRSYENFELFLNASGNDKELVLEWSYNTDLFDETTVRGWMSTFRALIARIISRPEARIVDLIGDTDLDVAVELPPANWSGTAVPYPRDKSISTLFDETVAQYGRKVALSLGSEDLTYAQLRERVLVLTAELIASGVQQGMLVGLCCERNFDMVVAQLAILRAGAAYVPIDHTYPEERLRFILEDTHLSVLLADPALADRLPAHSARVLSLRTTPSTDVAAKEIAPLDGPESMAYIMYTSGSTGKPKGVVVAQRGIVRLVRDQNYAPFGPDAVITQLSNVSFDASTFELWGALLNGGKLVLQAQPKPTLREITDTMERHGVNIMFITTGLFNVLVDEQLDGLKNLKCILTGGEAMSVPHITKALRVLGPGVLNNIYGPTENTTYSSFHPINSEADIGKAVPIGKAINNTFLYVLDEQQRPVPIGTKGELYTGGDGVAIGYWERPDLTAERFLADPFRGEGARMYRTGDLVRWNTNGEIEFLGRADDQVKVRGFRIELGEIENAISVLDGVRDRVVVTRRDLTGDQQLVAYVVPNGFDPTRDPAQRDALTLRIKEEMKRALPAYMVPAFVVLLASLPLNANGKVDKKQLPLPDLRMARRRSENGVPRTDAERALVSIFGKALGVEDIGVHDNFFELGGHSIVGIQVLTQVEQVLGKQLALNALFQAPTVAELAVLLGAMEAGHAPIKLLNLAPIQPAGTRIPLFCVHGDEANHYLPKYLGNDQPFYGFFHQGEDGGPIRFTAVEDIAAHFIKEMKQVRPEGPYMLCGYSFGGVVAYEMACQLAANGDSIPLLALLDTYEPVRCVEYTDAELKWYEPGKKIAMRAVARSYLRSKKPLPTKLRHFYIIDTYNQALEAYQPRPYNGPITLFKAQSSPGSDDMGWASLGKVTVKHMPGDHYNMIKEPNVQVLAAALGASIDKALQRPVVQTA